MITLQFILYNLTFLLVIAHFLDSAKEQEWTDFLYRGSRLSYSNAPNKEIGSVS